MSNSDTFTSEMDALAYMLDWIRKNHDDKPITVSWLARLTWLAVIVYRDKWIKLELKTYLEGESI